MRRRRTTKQAPTETQGPARLSTMLCEKRHTLYSPTEDAAAARVRSGGDRVLRRWREGRPSAMQGTAEKTKKEGRLSETNVLLQGLSFVCSLFFWNDLAVFAGAAQCWRSTATRCRKESVQLRSDSRAGGGEAQGGDTCELNSCSRLG